MSNPEGVDENVLQDIKDKVTKGLERDNGMCSWCVRFEEVKLPYRDLLAMARESKSLKSSCFYILNQGLHILNQVLHMLCGVSQALIHTVQKLQESTVFRSAASAVLSSCMPTCGASTVYIQVACHVF